MQIIENTTIITNDGQYVLNTKYLHHPVERDDGTLYMHRMQPRSGTQRQDISLNYHQFLSECLQYIIAMKYTLETNNATPDEIKEELSKFAHREGNRVVLNGSDKPQFYWKDIKNPRSCALFADDFNTTIIHLNDRGTGFYGDVAQWLYEYLIVA